MSNKQTPEEMIANFDQMQGMLTNLSVIMADYYKELKRNNMPEPLASNLDVKVQECMFYIGKK